MGCDGGRNGVNWGMVDWSGDGVDGCGSEWATDGVEGGRNGMDGVVSNGCSHGNWCGSNGYCSWCSSVHNGVESVDGISGVSDCADGTVWFNKAVLTLHDIPIPGL